ncbi:MAG: nucleotidyltransferase family protein [Planctomycetes bacterium]|nr:nucleotidyltransferase family protein [Planctomycetota bacterium]
MSNPPINAAAIILAAGDSKRMGQPKALLDWDGRPLLEHVLHTAREAGCAKLFVVVGKDGVAIRAGCNLEGVTVLENPDPSHGQISSIKLGMENLDFSTDCCLVWPVDCPLIEPGDVKALLETYAGWRASLMRIFIPTHQGERGHPMLVDIGFRQPFIDLPEGETARKVIDDNHTQVKEVPTDNAGVLVDVDTPEDYEAALKQWRASS